ncbi:hypothetical protein Q8A73_021858 [Channa argus]|nr:hypothetical protein Q8A73_021858 [Channa argus]
MEECSQEDIEDYGIPEEQGTKHVDSVASHQEDTSMALVSENEVSVTSLQECTSSSSGQNQRKLAKRRASNGWINKSPFRVVFGKGIVPAVQPLGPWLELRESTLCNTPGGYEEQMSCLLLSSSRPRAAHTSLKMTSWKDPSFFFEGLQGPSGAPICTVRPQTKAGPTTTCINMWFLFRLNEAAVVEHAISMVARCPSRDTCSVYCQAWPYAGVCEGGRLPERKQQRKRKALGQRMTLLTGCLQSRRAIALRHIIRNAKVVVSFDFCSSAQAAENTPGPLRDTNVSRERETTDTFSSSWLKSPIYPSPCYPISSLPVLTPNFVICLCGDARLLPGLFVLEGERLELEKVHFEELNAATVAVKLTVGFCRVVELRHCTGESGVQIKPLPTITLNDKQEHGGASNSDGRLEGCRSTKGEGGGREGQPSFIPSPDGRQGIIGDHVILRLVHILSRSLGLSGGVVITTYSRHTGTRCTPHSVMESREVYNYHRLFVEDNNNKNNHNMGLLP